MLTHHVSPTTRRPDADQTALRQSLSDMAPELFGRALRMARSAATAEDLVQDTVERAMRFEAHYQPGTNLRAWVYQILFSVFVTRCRRSRREKNALANLSSDPCAWTTRDQAAEMESLSPPVARALASVPPVFRDALVLVDLNDLPYKEAARQLGVPVGTVMSRLYRGRRMLAQAVGPCARPSNEGSKSDEIQEPEIAAFAAA
jgi:RNA polymerase sigma-70 factor, ECF subfamily